jgi:hypothetical protein
MAIRLRNKKGEVVAIITPSRDPDPMPNRAAGIHIVVSPELRAQWEAEDSQDQAPATDQQRPLEP